MKYIDPEKLIAEIERKIESAAQKADIFYSVDDVENGKKYDDERNVLEKRLELVTSLQQEQSKEETVISDTDKINLRSAVKIIRNSNHPFKENLSLTLEKYIGR